METHKKGTNATQDDPMSRWRRPGALIPDTFDSAP